MTIEPAFISFFINLCIVGCLYYLHKKQRKDKEELESKINKAIPSSRRKR